MTELLPCPFCGCPDLHGFEFHEGDVSFGFQCTKCWMTGPQFETKDEAIAAWNTRTASELLAALEGDIDWLDALSQMSIERDMVMVRIRAHRALIAKALGRTPNEIGEEG